jgi:predicted TIM-barrel fold metal-dependent hydrolase
MTNFAIIDAHHHIWDPAVNYHPWLRDMPAVPFRYGDYSSIRKSYMPDDYKRDAARFEIVKTVYVETEWDPRDPIGETRWISAVSMQYGLPNAVVAQAWLDRENVESVLAAQSAFPLVRSVRHKPKAAARPRDACRRLPGSMDDPVWRSGFAQLQQYGLHFDLQTPWWHFDAAADLARDFPGTLLIVNHAGLPSDRSSEGLGAWRNALSKLARWPNVRLKISGIGVRGYAWTPEFNRAVVLDAISIFGADRCMFASNFPVDGLVATFDQIFDGFLVITAHLSEYERRCLFHDTAATVYRL